MSIDVLVKLGFSSAGNCEVGRGSIQDSCINRGRRGAYLGKKWKEELNSPDTYDPETGIVEVFK